MSERKTYRRIREIELRPLKNGGMHYAELRLNPEKGRVEDCCVGYKVWHMGEYAEIVRYDSHPGEVFHRHAPGYPEPGPMDKEFPDTDMRFRGTIAVNDITENCETWQHVLPQREPEPAKLKPPRKEEQGK